MKNKVLDKPVMVIGEFSIVCFDLQEQIPYSGMLFYSLTKCNIDFQLNVAYVEPDNSGKLLFGSSDFYIPTFLYQRLQGHYDWIVKKHDGTAELSFRISPDWTKFTLYEDETGTQGERAFREFGSLFSYAVLNHHACVLHGVVMEYEGMGILVTAASGTGKTTHTRMWRDRESALIINGDRCLCRKVDGKWYAYGMPWAGSSGEYINRKVPINVIVSLKQDSYNHVRRMNVFEGSIYLMQRIFAPMWPGEMQNRAFDMCEELGAEIPMLELSCLPDFEAVDVLKAAILELRDNAGE
ncbi:MAG: hypothetical protein Q4F21_04680 [Lachnospiraceae bacterium]|nr:hypothetical protein [Lachnospiraceae bacterium]